MYIHVLRLPIMPVPGSGAAGHAAGSSSSRTMCMSCRVNQQPPALTLQPEAGCGYASAADMLPPAYCASHKVPRHQILFVGFCCRCCRLTSRAYPATVSSWTMSATSAGGTATCPLRSRGVQAARESEHSRCHEGSMRRWVVASVLTCAETLTSFGRYVAARLRQRQLARAAAVLIADCSCGRMSPCVQACMSAAMPHDENEGCCAKHMRIRQLAEAEGRPFSKYTVEEPDQYQCVSGDVRTTISAG
jgi:hypothetical protein